MVDKNQALEFLLKARKSTYASATGKVKPLLPGSVQYEYKEGGWSYIDVYNIGNRIFMGMDTVYYKGKPAISTSYFGNFVEVTEEEVDKVLRGALIANWEKARLWHDVKWSIENYEYFCEVANKGSLDEFSGTEKILKEGKRIYYFYYAGGFID